ncbi:MAG: integrase core domain-containing protein [Clostridia bacterium]|nr:integrase core domain-containing protein [Clostridia bacterium]
MYVEFFFKNYTNIKRSTSRVGTSTDNPTIESLNGWIKEEMRKDFDLRNVDNIHLFIENYVHYFNNERLSYKLNYTPLFNTK